MDYHIDIFSDQTPIESQATWRLLAYNEFTVQDLTGNPHMNSNLKCAWRQFTTLTTSISIYIAYPEKFSSLTKTVSTAIYGTVILYYNHGKNQQKIDENRG